MQKAARISMPMPASVASSSKTDSNSSNSNTFVPVAIFSGIGLLASLVAIITGVPGAWY